MHIIIDQNIPLADAFFGDLGTLTRLPGRLIEAEQLTHADVLLVRSVTQVNEALLAQSPIKFVGSCTIGVDHMDLNYLDSRGIAWASAPGCNANAVVQYVLSAMATVMPDWHHKTVGIIGCGNIGGRLLHCLQALGVNCIGYDPLLAVAEHNYLVAFEELLATADIISCHTPLTTSGPYPTYHMLDTAQLAQLKPGALLINASRGAVVNNKTLSKFLCEQRMQVVLDVWEGEPAIDSQLLDQVAIGTPHIAGYSLEGKERGTLMVYEALQRFLARSGRPTVAKDVSQILTRDKRQLAVPEPYQPLTAEQQLNELLLACYSVQRDDELLRQYHSAKESLPEHFDQLRKQYAIRRDYGHFIFPRWAVEDSVLNGWLHELQQLGADD